MCGSWQQSGTLLRTRQTACFTLSVGASHFHNRRGKSLVFKTFSGQLTPSNTQEDFYFSRFWFDILDCSLAGSHCGKLRDCPPSSSVEFMPVNIDMMTMSVTSYFVYNAVYAVAQGFHEMLLVKTEMGSPGRRGQPILLPWQVNALQKQGLH